MEPVMPGVCLVKLILRHATAGIYSRTTSMTDDNSQTINATDQLLYWSDVHLVAEYLSNINKKKDQIRLKCQQLPTIYGVGTVSAREKYGFAAVKKGQSSCKHESTCIASIPNHS